MPVERNNNLINNPSIIIPVRIRREQTETQNNNVTFPDLNEYQPVTPGLFNSYGINQPLQLKIERINDSESDMHEVFELDKLVFAEQDPYENYEKFKSFINNNQLSTYVVRDENDNNKILGYYQLEPVKNGDLYIDSIGLKPEYRNSRKGYQAIKASWANILNYARENGANTLSLHVTADNRNLLRMYESFGFTIKETLNNYYGNGADAYFMEKTLEPAPVEETEVQTGDAALQTDTPAVISDTEEGQNIETTQQNEISQAENVEQQPEAAPEEELYSRKFEQAKSELIAMGIPEDCSDLLDYLSECTRMKNGHQVFSDELFESVKYLIQVGKDYPDAFTFGQMTTTQLREIFNSLTENDENGSIRTMRTDLLPYVRVFAQNGISACYYDDIFNAAKETQPDGSKDISRKALDKVCRFKPYISDYYLPKIIQNCLLRDKDGRTYISDEALAAAEHSLIFNNGELFNSDIPSLLQFSKQIDDDGNQVFNKKLYNDLLKQVTDNNIPYDEKLFYGTSQLEKAYNIGCDMEALLKYGSIVIRNREIDKIIEAAECSIEPVIASETAIRKKIDEYYNDAETVKEIYLDDGQEGFDWREELHKDGHGDDHIQRIISAILKQAIIEGIHEIYFEQSEEGLGVFFKHSGESIERGLLPSFLSASFVVKLKTLSNLDPTVCEIPQLGKLCFKVDEIMLTASISAFPTIMGERILLKIYKKPKPLEELIPDETQRRIIQSAMDKPGIILVCGSSLSGKTHVIYSILLDMAKGNKNIMSIESIAKYNLPNVHQCELNENVGFNMDKALRFIEFQHPDVLYLEGVKTKEGIEFLSELFYNDKTVVTEFLANSMTDLRQKMNYIDFESFKSLISCLIFIHSQNSIEVFDKSTIKKYLV